MDTVLVFIAALAAGTVTGLVPGLGIFAALVIAYVWLMTLDPFQVVMFYLVAMSVSQYFGSVASTIFAIPGEVSSIPALKEGHALFKRGLGNKAIMYAATGSFIASICAVLISLIAFSNIDFFYKLFDSHVQAVILVGTSVLIILGSRNKLYINLLLFGLGFFLSYIGYHTHSGETFATFGISQLYGGIPLIPVVIALIVVPEILSSYRQSIEKNKKDVILSFDSYKKTFWDLRNYKGTLTRSTIIGYIAGFIPGMTFVAGTSIAYYVEKIIQRRKKQYVDNQGNIPCLIAAETANNAGVYSQMLPLLLAGIPITASEALVYEMIESRGIDPSNNFFAPMIGLLTVAFILSSIWGLFTAGKYANLINSIITKIDFKYVYLGVAVVMLGVNFIAGSGMYAEWYYMLVLLGLLPIGVILRKCDMMPCLFAFVLSYPIESSFRRIIAIHFGIV